MKNTLLVASRILAFLVFFSFHDSAIAGTGDTIVVQTLRFDTTMRAGIFHFPDDSTKTYEKIIMQYSMRCKNGLVSTGSNTNLGCGEWDYNCYTYVVDSSQTDSLMATQASVVITNSTDTVFPYTDQPVYDYRQVIQYNVNRDSVLSESFSRPSFDTSTAISPFANSSVRRSQYVWSVGELSAAGLLPGPVSALSIPLLPSFTSDTLHDLRISIKHTAASSPSLPNPETAGLFEVYHLTTVFPQNASSTDLRLEFYRDFNWDGISNLLIEISWIVPEAVIPGVSVSGNSYFQSGGNMIGIPGIVSESEDRFMDCNSNGNTLIVPPAILDSITNEITIAFWSFGDTATLPANTSIAYGTNSANNRHVNIHLPWSDQSVYWDCGANGGSFDRINRQASPADYKGRWTHWAFTKNATTGVMKIFLNGSTWVSGSGKVYPIDLTNLWFGNSTIGYQYFGGLDEISVWNKALDSASIAAIMYQSITPSHPDYANLLSYFPLNESSGSVAIDHSSSAEDATLLNPCRIRRKGNELFRDFRSNASRPDVTFVQGQYISSIQSVLVLDSVLRNPSRVITYSVSDNNLQTGDTSYVWPAQVAYIYDTLNVAIDSIAVQATDTLNSSVLTYYRKRPMYLELINFITPYGIGLNMNGLIGRTWEFDVTDYAPALRGDIYLSMDGARYQEDNDIRFVFYEGIPSRPVRSISNIWPNGTWIYPSWGQIYNNSQYEPRIASLDPGASMFKLRSQISGHGQEGEFIPRNHTLTVDGTTSYTRQVWKACADNPIYPQGGTWIYDRAGWCPGAAVDVYESDITSIVSPGQQMQIDYSMPYIANPGSTNYRVNHQLVTYGPPSFTTDAAIDAIKSPSKRTEYMRFNPVCDDPVVILKNNGSDPLTSVLFTYGREGGAVSTYQWTGSLSFLEKAEVVLPAPDWMTSSVDRFQVSISSPNGIQDQYPSNDSSSTAFNTTDTYYGRIVVEYKPNNYPAENTYTITDVSGNVLHSRTAAVAGFILRDTLNLPTGCYKLYMTDSGDDGLSFWANPNQGSGYLRFRAAQGSAILRSFQPDFGNNINYQFTMNYVLPVDEVIGRIDDVTVFPNPSSGIVNLRVKAVRRSDLVVRITDITGRLISQETFKMQADEELVPLELDEAAPGIYLVHVSCADFEMVRRVEIR
ncbi:MAG: peptide-N-glycosidase F-related protein [Bacteroidota bacterium]